jgi:hypothetical protein
MIHIVQMLCPQRHCILGLAYDDKLNSSEEIQGMLKAQTDDWVQKKIINPWCGICRAPYADWRMEDGKTVFQTIEEARGPLKELERRQQTTNQFLRAAKN